MLNSDKFLLFLAEGSTLPTPSSSNALEVTENPLTGVEITPDEFERLGGKLGDYETYIDFNQNRISMSASTVLRSNNKAGDSLATPPMQDILYQICGFTKTVDADSVTYTNSQNPTRGSAVINDDGRQLTMTNAVVGDFTISLEAGQKAFFNSTIQGYIDNGGKSTQVVPPNVTLTTEETIGLTKLDAITEDGTNLLVNSAEITTNPVISNIYGTGVAQDDITNYNLQIQVTRFIDDTNYDKEITSIENQTSHALIFGLNLDASNNYVDGKSIRITAPNAKVINYTDADSEGKRVRTTTYGCRLDTNGVGLAIRYGSFA